MEKEQGDKSIKVTCFASYIILGAASSRTRTYIRIQKGQEKAG